MENKRAGFAETVPVNETQFRSVAALSLEAQLRRREQGCLGGREALRNERLLGQSGREWTSVDACLVYFTFMIILWRRNISP